MFLLSYKNARESLGELEKSYGNTHLRLTFPQQYLVPLTSTCVS